jgi:hypothetical protein
MRRYLLLLASVVLIVITSCAATYNTYSGVTGTSPLNDNNAANCSVAEVLWPVGAGSFRMIHHKITQGAFTKEDSVAAPAGTTFSFPSGSVPTSAQVTRTVWASDTGGAGCPLIFTFTPFIEKVPPAKPTLQ